MYVTFRNIQAEPGHFEDGVAAALVARDRLNGEHGADYAVSINVGGDPNAISLSCAWESLGDYERMRAAVAGDPVLQNIMRTGGGMMRSVQDTITKVVKAPGERGTYATVNLAMMNTSRVAEAVPFALEVAEFIDRKMDDTVGVLTAVTGNRGGLMWISFSDSMDEMATDSEKLEGDLEYLEFFRRSEGVFLTSTLEQSIWHLL